MVALAVRRRIRGARGAELIELALILPLLLLLVGGIVDFAFLFQAFSVVNNAAREGARIASLPGYTNVDAQNRVAAYVAAAGLPATPSTNVSNVLITNGGAGAPTSTAKQVQVTYTHTFTMLGPLVALVGGGSFASTVNLNAVSVMRVEL